MPIGSKMSEKSTDSSRLMQILLHHKEEESNQKAGLTKAKETATSINDLIQILKNEAARIQKIGQNLSNEDLLHLR